MKQLFIIILVIIHFSASAQTPVENNGALSVNGNQILNTNGVAVSFAGSSLFWSNTDWGGEFFYNSSVVNWLYSDWNINIIRAAMGVEGNGGYLSDIANKQRVIDVIEAAIDQGLYVIIDWHSHHAEDYETEAIQFFEEMATLYGSYDNVIYEIYNEPLNTTSWGNTIKPYAESVISAIRAIDNDNLIIVGTPTWSQDVDIASNDPITGFSNIAYTLHFYAGTHGQFLRDKAQVALNNDIALMVTEWGTVEASGDGDVDQAETELWMTFLCDNKISHCNWALNDKNEGASALIPGASTTGNWTANDLTSSGILVKDVIENWNSNCNSSPSNVELNNDKPEFKLYPNPTSDNLYIKTKEDVLLLSLTLIDILGSNVLEINNPTNQLDLSLIHEGIFFLRIESNKGIFIEKLIIK